MREWLRLFKAGNWRLRKSLIAHPFGLGNIEWLVFGVIPLSKCGFPKFSKNGKNWKPQLHKNILKNY